MTITTEGFWAGGLTETAWRWLAIFGDQTAKAKVRVSLRAERKRAKRKDIKHLSHLLIAASTEPLDYRANHKPIDDLVGPVVRKAESNERLIDAEGNIAAPYRLQDTLRALLNNRTITEAEYAAGRQFQGDFEQAGLVGVRACDPERIPISGENGGPDIAVDARDRVHRALSHLGLASRGSSALWAVLGEGKTIKDHAAQLSISQGRKVNDRQIQGVFCGALSALAAYYYPEPRRPTYRRPLKVVPLRPEKLAPKPASSRSPILNATLSMHRALKK